MDFWNSLGGIVMVELTSADPVGALQTISENGIVLQHVEFIRDLTLRCDIRRRDYRKLLRLTKKRGDVLHICGKRGLYWSIKSLLKRPVLVLGICFLLAVILYLPTRVLFVQVEGNETIPSRQVLSAAEDCGINFWSSRRKVRSEKVKNALLGALPELTWAGVNTKGCVAVISVRERTHTEKQIEIYNNLEYVYENAFLSCSVEKVIYHGTLEEWKNIFFENIDANPLTAGGKLYINNELVEDPSVYPYI